MPKKKKGAKKQGPKSDRPTQELGGSSSRVPASDRGGSSSRLSVERRSAERARSERSDRGHAGSSSHHPAQDHGSSSMLSLARLSLGGRPGDRPSVEKRSADKRSADRHSSDKPSAERHSTDKHATEKRSSEKRSSEKRSAEKHPSVKRSAERRSFDKRSSKQHMLAIKCMRRPAFGTVGTAVNLEANFFKLKVPSNLVVYIHPISIFRKVHHTIESNGKIKKVKSTTKGAQLGWVDVSQTEPIFYNRNIFSCFMRDEGRNLQTSLAYDGRSIAYSAAKLNLNLLNTDIQLVVNEEGMTIPPDASATIRSETVKVRVHSSSRALSCKEFLSRNGTAHEPFLAALDVALAHAPSLNHVMVGRSFYSDANSQPLGRRNITASAWRGFYQSVRFTLNGPMVNFDESFTAFYQCGGRNLRELVRQANDNRDLSCSDNRALRDVAQRLKHLKVRSIFTSITYKVHGFMNRNADNVSFKDSSGRTVSVAEYFASTYNYRLRHPALPLVKAHPRRDIYIPIEVLVVVENQRVAGLLSPDQTQSIVRIASAKPWDRKKAALSKMQSVLNKSNAVRDSFGLRVETQLARVQGRILPPPDIQYSNSIVRPSSGQWRQDKSRFVIAKDLRSWAILLNARIDRKDVDDFKKALVAAARRGGMAVRNENPQIFPAGRNRIEDEMRVIVEQFKAKEPLQLIVIITERQDTAIYNEIKQTGDLKAGIATQVLLSKNVTNKRGLAMFCDNVILKINSKLGGQNSCVAKYHPSRIPDPKFLEYPHIVLGADVTHPAPGARSCSVAALVGSRDKPGVQYSAAIRNQKGRTEIIQDLGGMFHEVYKQWYFAFGQKFHAGAIIMFRDGVSEGQYEQVLNIELASLRRACEEISHLTHKHFMPKVTYIIVTKRHHTRFFTNDKNVADRSGNIPAGTVVDQTVTSADYYDFYLNSHAGIQGTSKPCKYVCLIDENNIPVDALQGYCYRLAHGFMRCNRSVSMVNSAYYAHLLAFRGRAYLAEGSDAGSTASHQDVPQTAKIHDRLKGSLFWV